MKIMKFIFASGIITFLLLIAVVFVNVIESYFKPSSGETVNVANMYSLKDMFIGVSNEFTRAILLCYLFPHIKGAGTSFAHAIKFNLVIAAIIGSLWLIAGAGSFVLKDPMAFFISDAVILFIQGLLSGVGLQILYKKQFI